MSLALARKYRPRSFAEVAVQSHVSNTLKGAIARGRVAHGYLLCGPRGTGKTTLARVLAMALNCESRVGDASGAGEPCGECASCRRIWGGSASLDVVEIDAASNRGVDDARELRERAMYAPSGEDRYKVYIVDEAHMLTREAWNALLKILEEPPPRVVFVFATTEPQKIAQTAAPVLSRLQRFDLKRIGPAEIRERLTAVLAAEGVPAEPEALAMLARAADGGLRDALSLTDQVLSLGSEAAVTAERVREALGLVAEDEFLAVLDLVAQRRAADVFPLVGRLADAGADLGVFLGGMAEMIRAQLAVVLGGTAGDVSDRARQVLEEGRDRFAPGDLLRMLAAITELEPRFRRSGQQQLLLETLLVRLALQDRAVEVETLLRELGGGGGGGSGATRPARPPVEPPRAEPPRRDPAPPREEPRRAAPADDGGRGAADRPGDGGQRVASGGGPGADPVDWRAMLAGEMGGGPMGVGTPRARAPLADVAPSSRGQEGGTAVASPPAPAGVAMERESPRRAPDRPSGAPAAPHAAAPSGGVVPMELNRLVERWDEIVGRVRDDGSVMLATLLADTLPVAVSAAGAVTLEAEHEASMDGLEARRDDLLAALRAVLPGVERVALRMSDRPGSPPPKRLTLEGIREERTAMLRRRDPALGVAMDVLDLELMD